MIPNQLVILKTKLFSRLSLVVLFLISSFYLTAQTPTNFSGKWEFDKASSDKGETGDASFKGTIILDINQTPDQITTTSTFFLPGKDGIKMPPIVFSLLAGIETSKGRTGGVKIYIKWSDNKKILTTNSIMTDTIDGVPQDFLTAMTYRLSEDGKTLFIDELHKSKLNGEKTIKKVYKKKV
jgi:hypothetical protein